MKININLPALHTNRMYNRNVDAMSTTLEKLSSGKRINHAADDAAGLAISEKMHRTLRGLQQASRNTMDDISFVKTFEGALDEVHAMLQRMRELAVQGANDSYLSEDRKNIDAEIIQLTKQIDDIANNTHFNGIYLLKGESLDYTDKDGNHATSDTIFFQIGGEEKQDIPLVISDYKVHSTQSLKISTKDAADQIHSIVDLETQSSIEPLKENLKTAEQDEKDKKDALQTAKQNLAADPDNAGLQAALNTAQSDYENAVKKKKDAENKFESGVRNLFNQAIGIYGEAIGKVSSLRSQLGAIQNRLESSQRNLAIAEENVMEARSRIENVDMAQEYSEYVRTNILHQASTSMLGHANQLPQAVLQLLNR